MKFFAQIFGPMLGYIYGIVGNYGFSIIIFTIIIKLILLPLSLKQLKSSKEMANIQPKMKEIQEKYKDNKEKQSQMVMELYREHNINPLAGCLPTLIQFPIILGLFTALKNPELYVFASDSVLASEAIHQSFLWMKNLSLPDLMSNIFTGGPSWFLGLPGLMPILSASLTYLSIATSAPMPETKSPDGRAMPNPMKFMKYVFPALILLYGRTFTSGLVLYWTISTLFSVVQQKLINNKKKQGEMI